MGSVAKSELSVNMPLIVEGDYNGVWGEKKSTVKYRKKEERNEWMDNIFTFFWDSPLKDKSSIFEDFRRIFYKIFFVIVGNLKLLSIKGNGVQHTKKVNSYTKNEQNDKRRVQHTK